MRDFLHRLLVQSPIYPLVRYVNDERLFRSFTDEDRQKLEFYSTLISPGDLVFDVGANMGNRTKLFLRLEANVVAFEPQELCAKFLARVLKNAAGFTLVRQALGAEPGAASMRIANAHTISSLSEEWVESTTKSGRFSMYRWDKTQPVELTTLDAAIAEHGIPTFIKIDVEGYEYQVLAGLSRPVPCISIEFTPEYIQGTYKCLDHLASLSAIQCQYAVGESIVYELPEWISAEEMKCILADIDPSLFGDVYIRSI